MPATVSEPREADRAPSFEATCKTHQQVLFTHDALRLYWTLNGPLISAISVMDDWEDQWMELHLHHAIPGPHNDENDEARFGSLADFDFDSDSDADLEEPEHLLRCYRGDRPQKTKVSLAVNVTKGFLTVHNYVSAVHPWLMGLREKILQASGFLQNNVPLPSDTRLMITSYSSPDLLVTLEEEQWKQDKSRK